MAEIFLATQLGREGFQKPVILKRIHSTIYADPQFRNMFIDEAHISMSLAHSNIAQVLDLGVAAGPLLPGARAGRRLGPRAGACSGRRRRASRCRASWACYIIADVCRALAYAHGKTDGTRAAGDRPPRRQPAQHPSVRAGRDQADRLRHRQGDEQARADRDRRREGEGRVHVARAGDGQADRSAVGSVLAGDGPLSADGAGAAVRGADRSRDAAARAEGRLHAARGGGAGSGARGRGDHQPRAEARRERALPERRRDARRHRARRAQRVPAGRSDRAQALAGGAVARRTGSPRS